MNIKTNVIHDWVFSFGKKRAIEFRDDQLFCQIGSSTQVFNLADIHDFSYTKKGPFWSKVIVPLKSRSFVMNGFRSNDTLATFKNLLNKKLKECTKPQAELVGRIRKALNLFEDQNQTRYMKLRDLDQWLHNFELNSDDILNFSHIYLKIASIEEKKTIEDFQKLIRDFDSYRSEHNKQFVKSSLKIHKNYFDQVESSPLTEMQRLACVTDEENNLILAGAGSGKTSVIVSKAGFIKRMGWANAEEILILAFGQKASQETEERVNLRLGEGSGISANTFHSLGLKIIGQATGNRPRLHDALGNEGRYLAYIDSLIGEFTQKKPTYAKDLVDYFSMYLYPLKDPIEFESEGEYFQHIKNIPPRTLRGEIVKSKQEVQIANFLYSHQVEYIYEQDYEIRTSDADYSQYRPDFYLPDYGIYIEHFGVDEDGNPPSCYTVKEQQRYKEGMHWKQQLHKTHQTKLIQTYSYQFERQTIWESLREQLEIFDVALELASPQDILESSECRENARKIALLMSNFLNLQKNKNASIKEVVSLTSGRIKDHSILSILGFKQYDRERLEAFLRIYTPVYEAFEHELRSTNTVDFNDMINEAVRYVRNGSFKSPWKYILIDEFQDISTSRAHLVQALAKSRNDSVVFCVGDDWQSIFRFTGADLNFLNQFEKEFGTTARTDLDLTFRFGNNASRLAGRFITRNPDQLTKEVRAFRTKDDPPTTVVLQSDNESTAIMNILDKISEDFPTKYDGGATIYFIGRYQHNKPKEFDKIQSAHKKLNFLFDTIHASKGKEADFVLLLGLEQGKYGFPSEIQDDPLLDLMLPVSEEYKDAEERRLFYVGLTRSRYATYILSDQSKPSSFITELIKEQAEYGCEVMDVHGNVAAESFVLVQCDKCRTGIMSLRANPVNDKSFYGCSNFPLCSNTLLLCPKCSRGPLQRNGSLFSCNNCKYGIHVCPECNEGYLKVRKGPFGQFIGCSNFRGKDRFSCTYKRNLD